MLQRAKYLFYYLYSFLWCLRYLCIRQAFYVPVLVHPRVKVAKLHKGSICFNTPLRHGLLTIGFDGTIGRSNCQTIISISKGGKFIVGENVLMARGTRLVIGERGVMIIGNNFWCNCDCYFNCTTKVIIGDNNMYGWNVGFNTSDGHSVYVNGLKKTMDGNITVENHVWIASNCTITKCAYIAEDCVLTQKSLINKAFNTPRCMIGGIPAKVLKEGVTWSA